MHTACSPRRRQPRFPRPDHRLRTLALAFSAAAVVATADVIMDWNALMLDAVRTEDTGPPLAARNLAIMHAAMHDAVRAVDPQFEAYHVRAPAPAGCLADVAAVAAAHEVAINLFPSERSRFDDAYEEFLTGVPVGSNRRTSLDFGRAVADVLLELRSADGASTSVPYIPQTEPGQWRRTPPFFRPPELPQWPDLTPFTMTHGAQFRPPGPPALGSAEWAADFNQVKQLGSATSPERTAEQTTIARFWSDFSYTVTPPGHWNEIAQNVAAGRSMSLAESARLFALLNLALADAGIVAWDAKYQYNFWRPVTAIRAADTDGNPDTEADDQWTPLLNTPAFPEYVSGHSTFSGAGAAVLAFAFGADAIPFVAASDTLPGVFRTYVSFHAAAEEIGMSRIYCGIHYLTADLHGLDAGHSLAMYVTRHFLRPPPAPPQITLLTAGRGATAPRVRFEGTTGSVGVVEASNDLREWSLVASGPLPFVLEDDRAGGATARFYRARADWR